LQIGQLIAARLPHMNSKIEAVSLREYPGAPRSPDTSLDCSKVQPVLSFTLPSFSAWLTSQSCSRSASGDSQ